MWHVRSVEVSYCNLKGWSSREKCASASIFRVISYFSTKSKYLQYSAGVNNKWAAPVSCVWQQRLLNGCMLRWDLLPGRHDHLSAAGPRRLHRVLKKQCHQFRIECCNSMKIIQMQSDVWLSEHNIQQHAAAIFLWSCPLAFPCTSPLL
jgi:hypothetical protein